MFKRTHYGGLLSEAEVGREVFLCGWVNRRRDLGGLIFIDLRDKNGIAQIFFDPEKDTRLFEQAKTLRNEYVVGIKGAVVRRPKENENPALFTGKIEVLAKDLVIMNTAKTPAFPIAEEVAVEENVRLKYRFLDLRRASRFKIFQTRHKLAKAVRDFLDAEDFLEVETPIMTKSTPEGARDYLVPSRFSPGKFYALAQSPQLFKQLLMVAGFERYFQLAKCFRDEDLRADRQPEFTQIDLELSFIERDELFALIERLLKYIFKSCLEREIKLPFPRLTYQEVMERYGTDKPDLRFGLEMVDLTEFFAKADFQIFKQIASEGGKIKGIRLPTLAELSRKKRDEVTELFKELGGKGLVYLSYTKEGVKAPFLAGLSEPSLKELLEKTGAKPGDLLLLAGDQKEKLEEALGRLRIRLAKEFSLIPEGGGEFNFAWVIDFPLFKYNEEEKRLEAEHHPFTCPLAEDFAYLKKEPLKVRAASYDLVLNGYEIASGSIRIHQRALQEEIFSLLGISQEDARLKFGFLLDAFEYGAPPHGGIALGFDRLVAIIMGEESIREVIAFPKNLSGVCPLTESPVEVTGEQLKLLGLRLLNEK